MKLFLKIWRQEHGKKQGSFQSYVMENLNPRMSFLEMLDQLNEKLVRQNQRPVVFDHDCREGICGACSLVINGEVHGPETGSAVCQLHLRSFEEGSEVWVEPFRAQAFPLIEDLMVDRQALDRVIQAGGFVSLKTGQAPEARSFLVGKQKAQEAFSFAACIGCGACVAACKNASASLFVAARLAHLARLPQGQVEGKKRTLDMVRQMEKEGFGACTNTGACSRACPKEIPLKSIAEMNKNFLKAWISYERGLKSSEAGDS